MHNLLQSIPTGGFPLAAADDYGAIAQVIFVLILLIASGAGALLKKLREKYDDHRGEEEEEAYEEEFRAEQGESMAHVPPASRGGEAALPPVRPPAQAARPGQPAGAELIAERMRQAQLRRAAKLQVARKAESARRARAAQTRGQTPMVRLPGPQDLRKTPPPPPPVMLPKPAPARPKPVSRPVARPASPAPAQRRRTSPGSLEQRHVAPSARAQEVGQEMEHFGGRLADEQKDRTQRMGGQVGQLVSSGPLPVGQDDEFLPAISLSAEEARRAIIYTEVIGLPLALRERTESWQAF